MLFSRILCRLAENRAGRDLQLSEPTSDLKAGCDPRVPVLTHGP